RMNARFLAAALATMIAVVGIVVPASAQQNGALTDQGKTEQIIHDYLLAHPEVIIEALQKYQAQQDKATAARQAQALIDPRDERTKGPDSRVLGNPSGNVTIVEFFDYRCPYCKSVAAAFIDMFEKDGNVRLVLKEFPILGADSEFAAKAALAAQKQG